jgi:ubiquinone/menaquinone biosynthesis C-methylase UbiE
MEHSHGTTSRKLHLGCGEEIKEGWVNLDIVDLPGVDIVHDLTKLPLPFEDNSFDEILCKFILEHVDWPPLLKEINRILAPGGSLEVHVPHFTSKQNFTDPQHIRLFSIETFDFFIPGTRSHNKHLYYFDYTFSGYAERKITFEHAGRIFFLNKFVEKWVNKSYDRQQNYESLFLSRIFPAQNIKVVLVK